MNRIRNWLGNQLMAFAIRLLCPEDDIENCLAGPSKQNYEPEEPEDDDGQPMPAVELSEKAKAMVYRPPSISKPTIEIKPQPLSGSYADRVRRARGV